jgi:hypothetical protein
VAVRACWCVLLLIHHGGLSGLDGETFYQVAKSAVDQHRWTSALDSIPRQA